MALYSDISFITYEEGTSQVACFIVLEDKENKANLIDYENKKLRMFRSVLGSGIFRLADACY